LRNKIIAVNAVIVLLVGLLSWALMHQAIVAAAGNQTILLVDSKHDVQGAAARLQLDALRAERWLYQRGQDPAALDAFQKSTETARKEAATSFCDRVLSDARANFTFEGVAPAVAMLIDENGKMVGRNGSSLNAGRDIGADYPAFKEALAKGRSGSDIWANKDRQDSFVTSYAPVRGSDGKVAGMLAIGVQISDELARVSEQTTGRPLALVVPQGADEAVVAHSANAPETLSAESKDLVKRVMEGGKTDAVADGDGFVAAATLDGVGDGKHAALESVAPGSVLENPGAIATPILYVTVLGLIIVVIGGWMLGSYITRPINMLEEGLLAILNGQQDKRFELDHPELGGLAFRIDQLLNQLMGIEEDTTDEHGRPSKAPSAADFRDAMSVDRSTQGAFADGNQQVDAAAAQALAAEPAPQYYARIYSEYITAKKALGEQTDHITEQAFAARIQGMERDAAQKYGRSVRYQVHARNKEVVLLAVPLP
jgi:hypothetical protein